MSEIIAKNDLVAKNDFVEIEFLARIQDGEVFDTNIKEETKKLSPDLVPSPTVIAVGQEMVIKGLDQSLEGKELNKEYTETFSPEEAFGKRQPKMVRMIPMKAFSDQEIAPQRGMQFSLDGYLVRVVSVSGGRVLVDFNNPLAGKIVVYNFTIKRKVIDMSEKINALQDFFFKQRFEFEEKNNELVFKVTPGFDNFINLFEKPFKDTLGLNVKAEVVKDTKKDLENPSAKRGNSEDLENPSAKPEENKEEIAKENWYTLKTPNTYKSN